MGDRAASFSGGGPRPAAATRAAASSGSGPHWPRWTRREPQGSARWRSGCWPRPSCWPACPAEARDTLRLATQEAGRLGEHAVRPAAARSASQGPVSRSPGRPHELAEPRLPTGSCLRPRGAGRHDRELGQPCHPLHLPGRRPGTQAACNAAGQPPCRFCSAPLPLHCPSGRLALEPDPAQGRGNPSARQAGAKPAPSRRRFRPCMLAVHRTARRRRAPNPGPLPEHIQPHPVLPERRKR